VTLVRRPRLGYLLYLSAALMWSVNGTVSKLILETGITSMRLSQLRATAAFVILFIAVALFRRSGLRIKSWKEFRLLALYGVLGVTMTQWLYFIGITLLPVGVALIIEFTAPFMVAFWVKFVWDHHIPRLTWLGLAVALTGLVLITEVWNGFQLNGLGVIASAGAAAALAIYYLAGSAVLQPESGTPRDSLSLTMWGFAFATVFWAIFQPWWTFPWSDLVGSVAPWGETGIELPLWSLSAWMIVLGTVLPFWIVLTAMQHISAQQASAMGMTEPVLASLVAWIVMSEFLSAWQIVGGIVTLAGIAIAEVARK